ncbi:Peptidase family C25 [Thermoplasmatales archaeon SCGC AB-539-C06]|nr:Peptidase family C25 [Thermoplasmatales archaeon SCGC AB-539-C06]
MLIGGDADIVPDKMLYVFGFDEDEYTRPYETEMPVDMYYGYLDGPFNSDDDDRWGEPEDGENGSDVDLIAEIYVGRACADNVLEIDNFVTKTISYMNTDFDEEYLKETWMVGEYLGEHGVASWGGNYLDLLIDGSDLDGYTTVGIPSDKYNIATLYDRDLPEHWSFRGNHNNRE